MGSGTGPSETGHPYAIGQERLFMNILFSFGLSPRGYDVRIVYEGDGQ